MPVVKKRKQSRRRLSNGQGYARKLRQAFSRSGQSDPPPSSQNSDPDTGGPCKGTSTLKDMTEKAFWTSASTLDPADLLTQCIGAECCAPLYKILQICVHGELCVPPVFALPGGSLAYCIDGFGSPNFLLQKAVDEGLCVNLDEAAKQVAADLVTGFKIEIGIKLCLDLPDPIQAAFDFFGIDTCPTGISLRVHPLVGFLRAEWYLKLGSSSWYSPALFEASVGIEAQVTDDLKDRLRLCSASDCEDREFCRMCAGQERGTVGISGKFMWVPFDLSTDWGEGAGGGCCGGGGGLSDEARRETVDLLAGADPGEILLSEQPDGSWAPSKVYRWDDFLDAVDAMSAEGIDGELFWLGDSSPNGQKYGLVNVAAFLAQSMRETIKFDACDENNWDFEPSNPLGTPWSYSAANACGQLGHSYQVGGCLPAGGGCLKFHGAGSSRSFRPGSRGLRALGRALGFCDCFWDGPTDQLLKLAVSLSVHRTTSAQKVKSTWRARLTRG